MRPKQDRKNESRKWLVGRGMLLGTSVVAVVLGAILITLGWQSGHREQVSLPPTTTPPPSTTTARTTTPPPSSTTSPVSTSPTTTSPSATTAPTIVVSGTSIGSPRAPITVVEYSDFQCPFCQRFSNEVEAQIDAAYVQTGKVRFVFKYLVAFGDDSLLAAEAAQAAAEQNQFWPYHDALMQLRLNESVPDFSAEKAQSIAQQLGLNMMEFNASLTSDQVKTTVMQDDAEGRATGIKGIPAFFVNGVKAPDSVAGSFDEFSKVLDEALAGLGQ